MLFVKITELFGCHNRLTELSTYSIIHNPLHIFQTTQVILESFECFINNIMYDTPSRIFTLIYNLDYKYTHTHSNMQTKSQLILSKLWVVL